MSSFTISSKLVDNINFVGNAGATMRKLLSCLTGLLVLSMLVPAVSTAAPAAVWQPKPAPLTTPWTAAHSTSATGSGSGSEDAGVQSVRSPGSSPRSGCGQSSGLPVLEA